MHLTLITRITLQILTIMLQSLRNIIDDVFSWWYTTLAHILTLIILATSVLWNLRNTSAISLRNLKSMRCSLWSISLITFMILLTWMNMWNWSLTSALLDALILRCAAVELLDRCVLLKGSYVLGLPVLASIGWRDTWCWSPLVHWSILSWSTHTILVRKTTWWNLDSVLRTVLLLVIDTISNVCNLSSQ